MSQDTGPGTGGISIVSVYNDPEVLKDCLVKSIESYSGPLGVDFVPVDNTRQAFASAGAALNHGARLAKHDRLLFVHQDVYLHSIEHLFGVGHLLFEGNWGLLGANGMSKASESIGQMRDRVKLIGADAPSPKVVDSVDEVAFMALRRSVLQHPFTEDSDLAWHAYAVEYGLRLRRLGMKTGAVNFGVTHNSLTINLDRLDVAHQRVGELYADDVPIRTTCGTIGSVPSRFRELSFIRKHRWRTTWLRQSYQAVRINKLVDLPVVLADISHDVDLLGYSESSPLHVINMDHSGGFAGFSRIPLSLRRRNRPVVVEAVDAVGELLERLDEIPLDARVLVTDPVLSDIATATTSRQIDRNWVVGTQPGAFWLLAGPDARDLPSEWLQPKAVPLRPRSRPALG